MSRRKKQVPIFLPIFVNEQKKATFSHFRFEAVEEENEKGEKVKTLKTVMNEPAYDQYGEPYVKPMNRAARRIKASQLRLYEKKYGQKPLAPKGDENGNSYGSEGNQSASS